MNNPLLEPYLLPPFSRIEPAHAVPAIERVLADNRSAIATLLEAGGPHTWDSLAAPMEDLEDRLHKAWSPVSHLNSVCNSEPLRDAYNACLPLLSEYRTELGQNEALYRAYRELAEGDAFHQLEPAQRKTIEDILRDFRLSGVALPAPEKARYKEIALELSNLGSRFQDNLMDATQGWFKHIIDPAALAGIPESAVHLAQQAAADKDLAGWVFTLEFPSYIAVMTYADQRDLRREVYWAYCTRASERGPNPGRWDNGAVMERILALRHEEAQLLGFANYAELSLATKMARSGESVLEFLEDLTRRSLPLARRDLSQLAAYARQHHHLKQLECWDIAYYSEKLRQHSFALSEEEVKPYFPAPHVVAGMFAVVERLYGLCIAEKDEVDCWHPEVRFYEIRDRDGELRGCFYLDLYARPHKRGGAWMDDCIGRRRTGTGVQAPVAYLTCNFTPPLGDSPALLRHEEVLTLFHEFGHGLHHMLTRVDFLGVSGINGVEWDAVELPSQFMENFCWEREALQLLSSHYQSGQPLPEELFGKMTAARNFQSGMAMVRQLEFSLFDFRIHRDYQPPRGGRIYAVLEQVRNQTSVLKPPEFNRFAHSFAHIFAGGYAAGYYSYKWAEVLSSDAFSLFEENGVFDRETGRHFLEKVLEKGGSIKAMDLFVDFRGREPTIDALLRHHGLAA